MDNCCSFNRFGGLNGSVCFWLLGATWWLWCWVNTACVKRRDLNRSSVSQKYMCTTTTTRHSTMTSWLLRFAEGERWWNNKYHVTELTRTSCSSFHWFVLQLDRPAVLNAYVQPVKLPGENTPQLRGDVCTVSGWGVTQPYSYVLSPVLRAVDVKEISLCSWYYWGRITENMICAGSPYGGKDSCQVQKNSYSSRVHVIMINFSYCIVY